MSWKPGDLEKVKAVPDVPPPAGEAVRPHPAARVRSSDGGVGRLGTAAADASSLSVLRIDIEPFFDRLARAGGCLGKLVCERRLTDDDERRGRRGLAEVRGPRARSRHRCGRSIRR